uniref:RNA ligase domain-containing protein n=1 Tax=Amphimedon queenslandica TaxID=400682 RepID=A0A1X7V124_AMPQE
MMCLGVQEDDVILPVGILPPFLKGQVIVTEKLDGGNCSIYQGKVYSRTVNTEATHPSFGPIKQLASGISSLIPDNIQLFGENMFGIHSIEYNSLESFFYLFGVLEDGERWHSWQSVLDYSSLLGLPTVPVLTIAEFQSLNELQLLIEKNMKSRSQCGSSSPEGFVVRSVSSFSYSEFETHVCKYVRPNHIQTTDDWRLKWKQASLKK